jgi:polar amino acid transport system substrate-binding protein
MRVILIACSVFILALATTMWAQVAIPAQGRTTLDGVYTTGQASRGSDAYRAYCRSCHGDDLQGGPVQDLDDPAPALKRAGWGVSRQTLGAVYDYMVENMPYDSPGGLEEKTYVDIIAYLLQENGHPAGSTELPVKPDILKTIKIVRP